jgi:hypothetical protein
MQLKCLRGYSNGLGPLALHVQQLQLCRCVHIADANVLHCIYSSSKQGEASPQGPEDTVQDCAHGNVPAEHVKGD